MGKPVVFRHYSAADMNDIVFQVYPCPGKSMIALTIGTCTYREESPAKLRELASAINAAADALAQSQTTVFEDLPVGAYFKWALTTDSMIILKISDTEYLNIYETGTFPLKPHFARAQTLVKPYRATFVPVTDGES